MDGYMPIRSKWCFKQDEKDWSFHSFKTFEPIFLVTYFFINKKNYYTILLEGECPKDITIYYYMI